MGVVGDMRAHVQCGACLEPGGIDHRAVQDETAPASNLSATSAPVRQENRRAQAHTASMALQV